MMRNHLQTEEIQLTWQALTWRLLLTAILLLALISAGLPIFRNITTLPNTHVLPALTNGSSQTVIR
jgi:hypothetical protein